VLFFTENLDNIDAIAANFQKFSVAWNYDPRGNQGISLNEHQLKLMCRLILSDKDKFKDLNNLYCIQVSMIDFGL
jgi:hypothetical protein